ncbi:MAG: DUF494 domain-containing protein [Balneolia bacterium]|nr:DUF494 domain-containing protein [Balneolia bacterium]
MRTNVIDLIIQMVRQIRGGQSIKEIDLGSFPNADKSEASAAYSWILQKSESGQLNAASPSDSSKNLRILHAAERTIISTEAYGYLIELFNIGIITHTDMESIIESAMMTNFEKVGLDRMKELVAKLVFGAGEKSHPGSIYLSGSEKIN